MMYVWGVWIFLFILRIKVTNFVMVKQITTLINITNQPQNCLPCASECSDV